MNRSQIVSLSLVLALLKPDFIWAATDDLDKLAKEVPTLDIDQKVLTLVRKEIDPEISALESHYTIAKYVDIEFPEEPWFILDGYYVLPNGRIAMLDFVYKPQTRTVRAILNYPTEDRLLLEARSVCNPYKRYGWDDPGHEVSRSPSGEDGVEKTYVNVKGCPTPPSAL